MQIDYRAEQVQPNIHCVDLSHDIGYPLSIYVNTLQHQQPLFWQSWSGDELLEHSTFLQASGLPICMLLPPEQFSSIPSRVLTIAMAVPLKQLQLLQGMLISSAAMELALSNPLLFILLVDHAERQNFDELQFKAFVLQKRTDILRYLQLPSSPSVVRLLARTELNLRYFKDLKTVSEVLRTPKLLNSLRHVQQPCINHFLFLRRYRGLFWQGLLEMINPHTSVADMGYIQRLAQDSCALGGTLASLRHTTTQLELHNLHNRLIDRHNRISIDKRSRQFQQLYGDFPTPPLFGNNTIVPLSSWYALVLEGLLMRHCVASYHPKIHAGEIFIYQVHTSQRMTLAIIPKGKNWVIDELRGHANAPASDEAILLVNQWLSAANKTPQRKHEPPLLNQP